MADNLIRCPWCGNDPLYVTYHDFEWGVPSFDDQHLFEMLVLEGAQAGLSWLTVLRKRENYRQAFDYFEPGAVAHYGEEDIARLLANPGIIRNRLKIRSAITNARAFIEVQKRFGSFASFLWQFCGSTPQVNNWLSLSEVPCRTPESDALSRELKSLGFTFVGTTIIYSFMQAVGMVNDHLTSCHRYSDLLKEGYTTPS